MRSQPVFALYSISRSIDSTHRRNSSKLYSSIIVMSDLRLKSPFSMIVASPSKSGKTTWVGQLLQRRNDYFETPPSEVYYFFNMWSPTFDTWKEKNIVTSFVKGMCTREWLEEKSVLGKKPMLIVLDDQAMNITKDIAEIFAVASHQHSIDFILLAQNIFTKNKYFRDASLNTTYIVLGKNPRDQSSIRFLSQQMMPGKSKEIADAYAMATRSPYSFFFMDFNQTCPEHLRLRGHYLSTSSPMTAYIKK